jgi:hypothetical protein
MSINRTILEKVKEKTKGEPNLRDFILALLQRENEGLGWYTKPYREELEKHCKGGINK